MLMKHYARSVEGNQSRFLHIDEVKAAWKLVDPIIDYWRKDKV